MGKNETGAPRAFMKGSMELHAPLRIIEMLSIRNTATSQDVRGILGKKLYPNPKTHADTIDKYN